DILLVPLCLFLHTDHALSFFFSSYGDHRHLHSFPTRRSSDLNMKQAASTTFPVTVIIFGGSPAWRGCGEAPALGRGHHPLGRNRSEEHTSELQSRGHLVCRLLLEKKKAQSTRSPSGSFRPRAP